MIKDGHTLILPGDEITGHCNAYEKFLPYKLKVIGQSLYIEMVLTSDKSLPEGAEIKSINGIATGTLLTQLLQSQVRDGDNTTYPRWIIDNYFREFYSYLFGHPAQFRIDYVIHDEAKSANIAALPKDSINHYRQIHYPHKPLTKQLHDGIIYKPYTEEHYAVLTIRDFHKSILKKEYGQDFKKEIRKAFEQLLASHIDNLIIDLRNNQGGEVEYGVYLLSYLLQTEFSVVRQYYKVGSGDSYGLVKTHGEEMGMQKPASVNFSGKLFVLINGGSFSNSGIVATTLKQHQRAIFIGEESGGNNKVLAGYTDDCTLPGSKLHVEIPTKQFLLSDTLPLSGHGTLPDFVITETIADVLSNKDPQQEFAVQLIREQRNKK